jgi:hypothetical protein
MRTAGPCSGRWLGRRTDGTCRRAQQKDAACSDSAGSKQTKGEQDWGRSLEVEYRHADDGDDQAQGKNCIDDARRISTQLHGHHKHAPGKDRAKYRQPDSCKRDRLHQRAPDKPEGRQREHEPAEPHQK